MYAGHDFSVLASWCLKICDELAAGAGEKCRRRMRNAFAESSRLELAFWDAAWRLLTLPRLLKIYWVERIVVVMRMWSNRSWVRLARRRGVADPPKSDRPAELPRKSLSDQGR
jgi:hypothetical protein